MEISVQSVNSHLKPSKVIGKSMSCNDREKQTDVIATAIAFSPQISNIEIKFTVDGELDKNEAQAIANKIF